MGPAHKSMGSHTSGWHRGHAPRCEQRLAYDLARKTDPSAAGEWVSKSWQLDGGRWSADLHADPDGLRIEVWRCDDVGRCLTLQATQLAPWLCTPISFGGSRRWLACPACSRRCRALYFGVGRLACRTCLNLRYRSQLLQPHERAQKRADMIGMRLDPGIYSGVLDGYPPRPSGMRLATYRRLEAAYETYSAQALLPVMRFLSRAP
jgi:hypothetical protein